MNQQLYNFVSGLLFSAVALAHVYRALTAGAFVIGGDSVVDPKSRTGSGLYLALEAAGRYSRVNRRQSGWFLTLL